MPGPGWWRFAPTATGQPCQDLQAERTTSGSDHHENQPQAGWDAATGALQGMLSAAAGDDFEANQVAAEKNWGGKYIQFTAPVSNINSSGISFQDVTSTFSFTQVSCSLEDESSMLSLVKGKQATVRGMMDDDQLLGVIRLNECQVVGAAG